METCKEIQTGKIFLMLAFAINRTGGRNEAAVIYCPDDDQHTIYVKEYGEFCTEFIPCQK